MGTTNKEVSKSSNKGWYSSRIQVGGKHYLQNPNPDFFAVSNMSSSFDVELYELYWSVFVSTSLITTDPDFNVVSCGRRQLYIEPWW